jgi:PAS domain S-box-containing protein
MKKRSLPKFAFNPTWWVILPTTLATFVFVAAIYFLFVPEFERQIMAEKVAAASDLTSVAVEAIRSYHREAESGRFDLDTAKTRALSRLQSLRYGADGKNYFWVQTADPIMIMHPYMPELNGVDLSDFTLQSGRRVFVEFAEAAQEPGGGHVQYYWQYKDDESIQGEKVSHLRPYAPWGWIVGTGVYLDDVAPQLAVMRNRLIFFAAVPLALCTLLGLIAARNSLRQEQGRRLAKAAEAEAVSLYQSLFESAHDAFILFENNRIISANQSAAAMFHCDLSQLMGMTGEALSAPCKDDEQSIAQFLEGSRPAGDGGTSVPLECRARRMGGEVFDASVTLTEVAFNGRKVVLALIRDITERKRAEEHLERLAVMVEQTGEYVVISDDEERIIYANPAFERGTGFQLSEIMGETPRFLKSGKTPVEVYIDMWRNLTTGKIWRGRMYNMRKDESEYLADLTIAPLKSPAGKVFGYAALQRDVSREVDLESQVRQLQKLEALGTLAGGIAHDFNNVLSGIMNFAVLGQQDAEPGHPCHDEFTAILQAGSRAKELVRRILLFSRQSKGEGEEEKVTVPAPIARECISMLERSIPATIQIRAEIDDQCPSIPCDSTQFHQVLMNLCTNAYQAMEEDGGTLDVVLKPARIQGNGTQRVADLKAGDYVLLSVSDTGCGMTDAVKERIFDPYYTTKEEGKGTGLGLATVHGILKRCGGAIRVHSVLHEGTQFQLYWPVAVAADGVASAKKPAGARTIVQGAGERVLVVDDDGAIAKSAAMLLNRLGYEATAVEDPAQALELLRGDTSDFDLVITDKSMPGMSGIALADAVGAIRPGLPVLLMTGLLGPEIEEAVEQHHIAGVIRKPFSLEEITAQVRHALDAVRALEKDGCP